jgi:hypothetical protein
LRAASVGSFGWSLTFGSMPNSPSTALSSSSSFCLSSCDALADLSAATERTKEAEVVQFEFQRANSTRHACGPGSKYARIDLQPIHQCWYASASLSNTHERLVRQRQLALSQRLPQSHVRHKVCKFHQSTKATCIKCHKKPTHQCHCFRKAQKHHL